MTTAVTVEEKREFIRWLLKSHRFKRRECVWLFNYMIGHEQILQSIHFTVDAHISPKSFVASTSGSEAIPFRFYKGSVTTADVEKVFHELRLKPEEQTFIQINYPRRENCPHYARVFVDNPNTFKEKTDTTNELMDEIERAALLARIDTALDNNDRNLFMQLTEMLR